MQTTTQIVPLGWKITLKTVAISAMLMSPIAGAAGIGSSIAIDQQPLTVSNNVPGSLVLTPSVEWPTVLSMSNLGSFDPAKTYGGYFDPDKCYTYDSDGAIPTTTPSPQKAAPKGQNGYFEPTSIANSCSGAGWSGNYLNWAATATIDTFRSVTTGGYRVVDTPSMTVLEKARNTGQNNAGYLKINNNAAFVSNATPSEYTHFYTRLSGLGNKMYFTSGNAFTKKIKIIEKEKEKEIEVTLVDVGGIEYNINDILKDPALSLNKAVIPYTSSTIIQPGNVYSVNIDVQVCKSGFLESNCIQYGTNYKPEGTIQKYSKNFTYSIFGYLNISNKLQDGAALRANQKFVGPKSYDPVEGVKANPNQEWDATTGVFFQNPDPTNATDTTNSLATTPAITDSGVINYINKFGGMVDSNLKSFDPVSEMYYAAIRYLKNQGAIASYSDITTYKDGTAYKMADGFPVITQWDDPIKYQCQKSFILGIGDVNTWNDKNLPGNTVNSGEPTVPSEVSSDSTVNVMTALDRIATIENIEIKTDPEFSGRSNSAYIAALAYDAHTVDMRPDFPNTQTASTFWVDVEENQVLKPFNQNQYLLAAKYGGFTLPAGYDPYTHSTAFPDSWWTTNGETLKTSKINQKRPDNFFEGGNATSMRKGLEAAFSAIASANTGSSASISLNSTKLEANSTVYQASYTEGSWSGVLKAFAIDPVTQDVATAPTWSSSLWATGGKYTDRKAYTLIGGNYKAFNSTNVTGAGWTADTVDYVLGDASKEIKNGGALRSRVTAIGDIVNSQPIYVGAPSTTLYTGVTFTGSGDYSTFASAQSSRTPVVYDAANDGFLHGFNANTGVETYAYMPGAVVSASLNPSKLAEPNYGSGVNPHQFFNDGEITVADVYLGGAWKTVLVGTTGRGTAAAVYALDITDPANVNFLWEESADANSDIGQITGKPIIAMTAKGWRVLIGNGYNSSSNTASLLNFDLSDGTLSVHSTDASTDNGLATPAVWIPSLSNNIATEAYAGDLLGRVWSFDLSKNGGKGKKVFSTPNAQPITSGLTLAKDPSTNGRLWGFFGTGKYLTTSDLTDKSTQSWYGLIIDDGLVDSANLLERKVTTETAGTATTLPARTFTEGTDGDIANKSGWFINLLPPSGTQQGERMLVSNQIQYGLLIGSSWIPDTSDPCAPGGRGWVMALDLFTGTNLKKIFFDLNDDGNFDSSDLVNGLPASGVGFKSLTGSPAFTGTLMLVNQNGVIAPVNIQPPTSSAGRVSWRELVNQ